MYKNQSTYNYEKQSYEEEPNMYLITRRVARNLAKNVIDSQSKLIRPFVANDNVHDMLVKRKSTYKQQNLVRFPAFPLDETLNKFILSVQPLLNEEELSATECEVEKFRREEGPKLQKLLEKAAETDNNWLAGRWQRYAYLQYRDPVAVYINPGMTFPLQKFRDEKEWLLYTAKIVYGLIKYKQVVDCGQLPVVKMGKLELDNSQFHQVYGTCRIPKPKEDGIEFNPDSQHIAVVCKSHWYKLQMYDNDGNPLAPEVLVKEFEKIVHNEKRHGPAIGILSTDNRDNWAESYSELTKSPENEKYVRTIQKSLFTLALDDHVSCKDGDEWNVMALQLIYGGGSKVNTGNRWMDKTIQLISNPNGMSGFCYEHSPAEGQPIAEIVDYVIKNYKDKKFYENASKKNDVKACHLKVRATECLQELIDKAASRIDRLGGNLKMNVLHFQNYGKEFLKSQKLSPDSFIQIALQYAFCKMHKGPGAQYESAHLRIYYGGRTETIRSCSNEAINFAKAMANECIDNECRIELLRKAITHHKNTTVLALQGRGVDRHLLGLKMMAAENKLPVPKIFSTPGWIKSTHFRISTSQVASKNPVFMAYGPAVEDGYGCCYNPRECDIILAISSWKSSKDTCAIRYSNAVCSALMEMHDLLLSAKKDKCSKL